MIATLPSHADWHKNTKSVMLSTGITMHYMEAGDPNAQPLLLIHGFTDSSRIWRLPMLEMQDAFHIFAVDCRGCGQSDKPESFLYTMKEFVEDLVAFMDAVHVDSAFVLAHSMGTLIGQTLAFMAPDRVKKLILAAPMMCGHDSAEALAAQYKLYDTLNTATAGQKELQEMFLPNPENCRDPEFPDGYFETLRGVPARILRAIWFGVHQTDNRRFAQFITAPVMIIWGDQDDVLPEEYQKEVREAFLGAPYIVMPGISHEIPNEMPEKLAGFAKEFFLNGDT